MKRLESGYTGWPPLAALRCAALAIREQHFSGDHSEVGALYLAVGSAMSGLERQANAYDAYQTGYAVSVAITAFNYRCRQGPCDYE